MKINFQKHDYLVVAHRGYSSKYPENTLLAVEEAYKAGANAVEIDLRMTRDGEIVLLHDESVDRTTDGSGFVKEMDWEAVKQLKGTEQTGGSAANGIPASQKKTASSKGSKHIPRLEDVLELISGTDRIIELDIKDPKTIKPAIDLIRSFNLRNNCFFVASDSYIEFLSPYAKEFVTYYEGTVYPTFQENLQNSIKLQADLVNIHGTKNVTEHVVNEVHNHCKFVRASWLSEDDREEAARLLQLNVNFLLTDFPESVLEIAKTIKDGPQFSAAKVRS
jgi:glycerophosphoryl diester phosphodiesterase